MQPFIIFILFLGPLVFFHELGHFLFARLAGVRVETFSIGFGPKLFKWKKGDTQYAISLIPLGGYVKMFGDDMLSEEELTEDEKKVAYTEKSKWARFWIVFGGPLANFILAFFLYLGLTTFGESVPQARFGMVSQGSDFYKQGFRTADLLVSINGEKVQSFDDLSLVDSNVKSVTIERAGEIKTFNIQMNGIDFIQGFSNLSNQLKTPIFSNNKGQMAYLTYSNQELINTKVPLENIIENSNNDLKLVPFESNLKKIKSLKEIEFNYDDSKVISPGEDVLSSLRKRGWFPIDLVVDDIVAGSPAEAAGIKSGDIILAVNGQDINSFEKLRSEVQKDTGSSEKEITLLRKDKKIQLMLTPQVSEVGDNKVYTIGVYSGAVFLPLNMVTSQASGVFQAISSSIKRTLSGISKTFDGYFRLFTAQVSLKHIGGPLAIGKVASDSFDMGLSMFFRLMAIISINLGLINLFPIPVLDGGHIVFIILEAINGGPLSKRKLQVAQQFGMSILFLLIFVSLFNDISRLF